MSCLKNKSEINIASADLLYNKGLFPSTVHCAYYGCIQLMKYIICNELGINYQAQASEISQLNTNKARRNGSHNYLIDKIEEQMKSDKQLAFEFVRTIEDLKKFREEADYGDIDINLGKSRQSIEKAKEIRKSLTNYFHL